MENLFESEVVMMTFCIRMRSEVYYILYLETLMKKFLSPRQCLWYLQVAKHDGARLYNVSGE